MRAMEIYGGVKGFLKGEIGVSKLMYLSFS